MTDQFEVIPELVGAIAEIEGTHPDDLEFTLYDHIEPDAIELLAVSEHTDWQLDFEMPDHTVEIHGNGQIIIDGATVRTPDRSRVSGTSTTG